ncbi:hypothetical protein MASR2M15_22330 [Anaerolineales bacterium]
MVRVWANMMWMIFILFWFVAALLLVLLPADAEVFEGVTHLFKHNKLMTMGHMLLFGFLESLLFLAFLLWMRWRWALILAVGVMVPIAIVSEIAQDSLMGRTPSMADLMANFVGIFALGFVISLIFPLIQDFLNRD